MMVNDTDKKGKYDCLSSAAEVTPYRNAKVVQMSQDQDTPAKSAYWCVCTLVKMTLASITCVKGERLLAMRLQETTCAQSSTPNRKHKWHGETDSDVDCLLDNQRRNTGPLCPESYSCFLLQTWGPVLPRRSEALRPPSNTTGSCGYFYK